MSKIKRSAALSSHALQKQRENQQQAEALLSAYHAGDPIAIAEFRNRCPDGQDADFEATLLKARMLVSGTPLIVRRLSLEKLKKEAKDLLKALKARSPDALTRLHEHHTKTINDELKLADAQLIIARENGLTSWPKLKAHIEAANHAREQINRPRQAPDRDLKTLHIRCGNDITEALKQCGFKGDFLEVSNPFAQGPVPHFDPLETFVETRTRFILNTYSGDVPAHYIENTAQEIRDTETKLRTLGKHYERVVLWYEHDSYDQLSKAYVLAHLANQDLSNLHVDCIQIDNFPGVKKFIGIGQLSQIPEAILTLWPKRKAVTPTIIASGARCWQAYTSSDPTMLWQITQESDSPLPDMQTAIVRQLQELPWTNNGLSLTEQLVLDILYHEGPMRPGAIFNLLMTESEPLPFLGDIMLLSILRNLWESPNAAIEVTQRSPDKHPMLQYTLAITKTGEALLEGKQNWLQLNEENSAFRHYIGGVHIKPNAKNWHWSPEQKKPVYK